MSTKAIEEVIGYFRREAAAPDSPRARKATEALAELEAIRKAARAYVRDNRYQTPCVPDETNNLLEAIAKESES